MPPDVPELMTLAEVLDRLRGKIARTALLEHLQAVPIFAGGPTHGRHGRRYLFTAAQYGRLVESLACPPAPGQYATRSRPTPAPPSESHSSTRARKLVDDLLRKPAHSARPPSAAQKSRRGARLQQPPDRA